MGNILDNYLDLDSCITITRTDPDFFGLDTLCLVLCDTLAGQEVCDTTWIIVVPPPPPDTIEVVIPGGITDTVSIGDLLQAGSTGFVSAMLCSDAVNLAESLITPGDTSLEITPTPTFEGSDTFCVVHCYDTLGTIICDTTYVIVIVLGNNTTFAIDDENSTLQTMPVGGDVTTNDF